MGHSLAEAIRELTRAIVNVREDYQPERHYMRGPGPKWHAKRAAVAAGFEKTRALSGIVEAHA
jgi:hypothetical protein